MRVQISFSFANIVGKLDWATKPLDKLFILKIKALSNTPTQLVTELRAHQLPFWDRRPGIFIFTFAPSDVPMYTYNYNYEKSDILLITHRLSDITIEDLALLWKQAEEQTISFLDAVLIAEKAEIEESANELGKQSKQRSGFFFETESIDPEDIKSRNMATQVAQNALARAAK